MTTSIVTSAHSTLATNNTSVRPAQRTWSYRTISEGKMARRFNRHAAAFRM